MKDVLQWLEILIYDTSFVQILAGGKVLKFLSFLVSLKKAIL